MIITLFIAEKRNWRSRQAHNLKGVGSSPTSARRTAKKPPLHVIHRLEKGEIWRDKIPLQVPTAMARAGVRFKLTTPSTPMIREPGKSPN